jgi:excinuclease ABC subunit C
VKLVEGVAPLFALGAPPKRIECYDNSHIIGTNAYGVMVVLGLKGAMKNAAPRLQGYRAALRMLVAPNRA